jgi:hypothetical protein
MGLRRSRVPADMNADRKNGRAPRGQKYGQKPSVPLRQKCCFWDAPSTSRTPWTARNALMPAQKYAACLIA